MSIFSKRNKKKLSSSSSKSATYYERENLIENIDDLKKVFNPLPDLKARVSKTQFSFNAFQLIDITFNQIKKVAGNPSFVVNNDHNIAKHEIVFYKDSVDYYKFLIQYHFINDRFFFASNKISSMGILSAEDKNKIVGQINFKYLEHSEDAPVKDLVLKIIDANNSIISTVDDVYFHVNYLAGNETTNMLNQKYGGHIVEKTQPSGFKKTLDKYI